MLISTGFTRISHALKNHSTARLCSMQHSLSWLSETTLVVSWALRALLTISLSVSALPTRKLPCVLLRVIVFTARSPRIQFQILSPLNKSQLPNMMKASAKRKKSGNAKKRKRKRNAKRKRLRTQLDASTKRPKRKLNAALSVNAKPKKNDAERWLKRQRAQRLPKLLSKSFAI